MAAAVTAALQPPSLLRAIGEVRAVWDVLRVARNWGDRPRRRAGAQAVLVIPGFLTNDLSTVALRRRLEDDGFHVYPWGLGLNRGPRDATMRQLVRRIRALSAEHGGPVHLVGWSMGGLLARVAASRARTHVSRVVTLASPLSGDPACSRLGGLLELACGWLHPRRVKRMLREAEQVEVTSIYSRNDGVVAWEASSQVPGPHSTVEVDSTHLGMVVNPDVLDTVAASLTARRPRVRIEV